MNLFNIFSSPKPTTIVAIPQPLTEEETEWDTLPDLISRALPNAHIRAPNVVIIGAQSSGKTKMIISMLFHYIIDHPKFTEEMGIRILRLFKTGESMVTRRPTTISFINSRDESVCNLRLQFGDRSAVFGTNEFDNLVNDLSDYGPEDVFEQEVQLSLMSHSVPNIKFTDFPGLTTKERLFLDTHRSVKSLIEEKIHDKSNTMIVVQESTNTDFSTSHIIPLIK